MFLSNSNVREEAEESVSKSVIVDLSSKRRIIHQFIKKIIAINQTGFTNFPM